MYICIFIHIRYICIQIHVYILCTWINYVPFFLSFLNDRSGSIVHSCSLCLSDWMVLCCGSWGHGGKVVFWPMFIEYLPRTQMGPLVLIGISALFWLGWPSNIENLFFFSGRFYLHVNMRFISPNDMIWILTRFSLFAIFHAIFPRGYCRSPIDLKCPQANGDLLNVGELDLVHLQSLYTDNGSMIYTFCWPIVLNCFSSWNFEFWIGMSVYQSQKSDWQTTFWWQVSIGFHHFTSQSVDEVISSQLMH